MSVEAYLKLIDRLAEAHLLVSGAGVVLGTNRRLARFGVEPGDLTGRLLSDVTVEPPEDVTAYLRLCAKTADPLLGSLTLRRADGGKTACRADGSVIDPASDGSGTVILLRLVPKNASVGQFLTLNQKIDQLGREVVYRKKAEAELRAEKERLGVTLRSIGDAVITTDAVGRVTFLNPVAVSLCGWSLAEAMGRPLKDIFRIVNETTRQPVENPVEKVIREGYTIGLANHTVLIARDNSETPIDDSAAPIVDERGEVAGVVLVFRDVTEKRRAAELKERLAAVVESSDDIIVSKNLDGVITSWNCGAELVLGYAAEEVIGRHVSMLMPPEQVEDIDRILGRIRRGEKVDHYETRRRRKDGTVIDVSLTVSPIRNEYGTIIGASKIGRDITQQKLLEAERAEADRRKDEFLAMLAHELRNPLSSINNAVQLFGRLETEEELLWAKEVVLRQVKHLARLIDDLLDVSRITRGKIGLRKEPLNLSPVVSSAVEAVRPLLEERKHELSVSLINGGLRLDADPLRLEQILVNLLTNAAKYTDAGGRISLTARHVGKDVVITVRDSGMGISSELLTRVFDLFAQGDRTMARSEGGLGIGLTLVQKLVEMHGGTVAAASDGAGKGSEFTVRLPALEEPAVQGTSQRKNLPRVARQSSRVLVVDDNIDTATGLARFLKLLGHDVRVAYDGPTAIEVARAHSPEIILLDIGLPGMDGYEVVMRLREEECCRDSLIIAASGYGKDEDRRRSREAGFDHHLVKPVDLDALMNLFSRQPN
jgi:PAS domain S-box-containing protein